MKTYFLKWLYQILFTKIDEEPHSSEYTIKRPLSESASKSIEQSISDVEKVKNYLPHTF